MPEFQNSLYGGMASSGALRSDEYLEETSALIKIYSSLKERAQALFRVSSGEDEDLENDEDKAECEMDRIFKRPNSETYKETREQMQCHILSQLNLALNEDESIKHWSVVKKEYIGMTGGNRNQQGFTQCQGLLQEIYHTQELLYRDRMSKKVDDNAPKVPRRTKKVIFDDCMRMIREILALDANPLFRYQEKRKLHHTIVIGGI